MTAALDDLPTWPTAGLCAGQPDRMADPEQAEATCRRCPVLAGCREWVLSIPVHEGPDGVVAAMTLAERERIILAPRPPKQCAICRAVKPLHEFAQNADGKPGRRTMCRSCMHKRCHRSKSKGTT